MKRWTIGNLSKHKADIGLGDETVSALHASLTQTDDGTWVLEDSNSTNGIARFVNGKWMRISQAQVGLDDRLRFGRAETTVRQLLESPPTPGPDASDNTPWTQDLALALSKIPDMTELKKNVLFVLDLIADPAHQTIRCVVRRRPVNPFSFMVFGGMIYTVVTAFGLTITGLMPEGQVLAQGQEALTQGKEMVSQGPGHPNLVDQFLSSRIVFIIAFLSVLVINMFPFPVFSYFTMKKRSFADFMRLTAVVSGMSWMLFSFVALLANQAATMSATNDESAIPVTAGAAFLAVVVFIYNTAFGVIAQKNFWRITYGRTLWCCVLSGLASFAVAIPVCFLAGGIFVAIRHGR